MTVNGIYLPPNIKDIMYSVCCVCNKLYDIKDGGGTKGVLSHGYCPKHFKELLETCP